jgi:hypothetical protein
MLGCAVGLLVAEKPGRARSRGLCLAMGSALLLGAVHSYDILTVGAVFGATLMAQTARTRSLPVQLLGRMALVGLASLPSTGYQLALYLQDPVFHARAQVPTLSPPLQYYLLGYGLLLPLAAFGAWRSRPGRGDRSARATAWDLLVAWSVVGFLVPYLPFAFQRKMAMGLHFPLAILAGIGLRHLLLGIATARLRAIAGVAAVVLLSLTSIRLVTRDLREARDEGGTHGHSFYWSEDEFTAMGWLRDNAVGDPVVLADGATACRIPGETGLRVWAGHWGETPAFRDKYREILRFLPAAGMMSPRQRHAFFAERGITYFYFGPRERLEAQMRLSKAPAFGEGDGLRPVYHNASVTIFQVQS